MKNRYYGRTQYETIHAITPVKPKTGSHPIMAKFYTMKLVDAYPAIKEGKPGYKIVYKDGYVSWCPKEVFDAASIPAENIAW